MNRRTRIGAALAGCLLLAACNLDPRTATLPGGVATGDDGYSVTAVFSSVDNLIPNAEVQYHDVRIGTVRSIHANPRTWRAEVRISVLKKVHVPANVTATIGQKSLLGAEYVELDDPSSPARTALAAGDRITRTGQYPETEDVLSAASMLLNDGGLGQLKTITTEIDKALRNRGATARDLITQLTTFVGSLNDQRTNLVSAIDRLDVLAKELAGNRDTISRALTHITPAVATLNRDKTHLTDALKALTGLSTVATRVIADNKDALAGDLALLRPTLTKLAQAGDAIPRSLPLLGSFPFPVTTIDRAVAGDYMNVYVTLNFEPATVLGDLGLDAQDSSLTNSVSTLEQILQMILGHGNPLTDPLRAGGGSAKPASTGSGPARAGSGSAAGTPAAGNGTSATGTSATGTSGTGTSGRSTTAPAPLPGVDCATLPADLKTLVGTLLGGC